MIDDTFRGRLLSGERILWTGQPKRGLMFAPRDILLVPFSLLWCGFAIFWESMAFADGAPGFFPLWGAMFVCIGLYFVAGRFIVDAWIRSGISYALTDQRILILRSSPFAKFIAVDVRNAASIDLSERSDGSGTIRFGQAQPMSGNRGMSSWSPALDPTPQFIGIKDVRRVFDLIQKTGKKS